MDNLKMGGDGDKEADAKKMAKELRKENKKARKLEKLRLKLLKAENKKKDVLRDQLGREIKFTNLTQSRADKDWEQLCIDIRVPELRDDFQRTIQGVDRMLDKKAHVIGRLQDERKIADEQYRRNVQKHTELIEFLLNLNKVFMDAMEDLYRNDCEKLVTDFHREIRDKERAQQRRQQYYENVLHTTNVVLSTELEKMKVEFNCSKDEKTNTSIERRSKMSDSIIKNMNTIHIDMKKIIDSAKKVSESPRRKATYMAMVQKEEIGGREFIRMHEEIFQSQKSIDSLQKKLSDLELKSLQKISDLKHELDYLAKCFWILKNKYDADINKDKSQLRDLVAQIDTTTKLLEKHRKTGELILGIGSVTRKFQTQKEKIMPWPDIEIKDEDDEEAIKEKTVEISQMDLFWYKVSMATSNNLALREERKHLTIENESLRDLIRRYCHINTYNMMINTLQISPYKTSTLPVQEASHMYKFQKRNKRK